MHNGEHGLKPERERREEKWEWGMNGSLKVLLTVCASEENDRDCQSSYYCVCSRGSWFPFFDGR